MEDPRSLRKPYTRAIISCSGVAVSILTLANNGKKGRKSKHLFLLGTTHHILRSVWPMAKRQFESRFCQCFAPTALLCPGIPKPCSRCLKGDILYLVGIYTNISSPVNCNRPVKVVVHLIQFTHHRKALQSLSTISY